MSVARHAIIDGATAPTWVDPLLAQSWKRCSLAGRNPGEKLNFIDVSRPRYQELIDANRTMLSAAEKVLPQILRALEGIRCGAMVTDANSIVLASLMSNTAGDSLSSAMRHGLDLSEQAAGTTAMDLSIRSGRIFSVFGEEHFQASVHGLYCISAPIRQVNGSVVGALDVTSNQPIPANVVRMVIGKAAAAVEAALFNSIHCKSRMRISLAEINPSQEGTAILALGDNGEVLAANTPAQKLFIHGDSLGDKPLLFDEIFEDKFTSVIDRLKAQIGPQPLQLPSGLTVYANLDEPARQASPGKKSPTLAGPSLRIVKPLDFGDSVIERELGKALKALNFDLPILLNGPTGTGKEVAALWLHENSARSDGPFVALNCAAIPEGLIESELFGYVEGAFTGARKGGAPGKIELAHNGTLFLDEIGDMRPDLQARLLRVLEERRTTRLGDQKSRPVDFHLVSATHQDLAEAVNCNRFREDLYYRIKGLRVHIKPLVERQHFLVFLKTLFEKEVGPITRLSAEAENVLVSYRWPGNIRELCNVLKLLRATVDDDEHVLPKHLPEELLKSASLACDEGERRKLGAWKARERDLIEDALDRCKGNVTAAAELLGVSRATLYRRLKSANPGLAN